MRMAYVKCLHHSYIILINQYLCMPKLVNISTFSCMKCLLVGGLLSICIKDNNYTHSMTPVHVCVTFPDCFC